jgi:hypothetical protein
MVVIMNQAKEYASMSQAELERSILLSENPKMPMVEASVLDARDQERIDGEA